MKNDSSSENYKKYRGAMDIEYRQLYSYVERLFNSIERSNNIPDVDLNPNSITPYLLKHSIFISVYSFMEYSLKEFCVLASDKLGKYQRRVGDFDKTYQYYYFLIDELLIDKSIVDKEWQQLNIFKDIRNSIVHYNSSIGRNISSKSFQYIIEDPRINFEESGKFRIEDISLIYELIELSRVLVFALMDDFEQKYEC